jgi:hypothetical protein
LSDADGSIKLLDMKVFEGVDDSLQFKQHNKKNAPWKCELPQLCCDEEVKDASTC